MKNITRKLLAVLSAAVMVCLLIPVGTVAAAQFTDPIVNGGFENGAEGWDLQSGVAEIVTTAHSGSKALCLTNPGQWGSAGLQTIPCEPNTDYVFTWYAKRLEGTGAFNLYVMNADGYANVERLAGQNWMNDKSSEWIKYEYTINSGAASALLLKWSTEAKNPGKILIDDFTLAKVGGDDPAAGNIESLMGNIKTQGRTAMIDGTLMLDFALSGIEFELDCSGDVYATFNARKLASTSSTGGIYFTIVVDGVKQARDFCRITTGGETKFLLASNLPAGKHTFAIYRQSEHQYGEIGVSGLTFEGTILDKPADKDLYIEFIGDSISCGFGNLGNASQGDGAALWSDGTQAYTYLTANALNADWSNVAWSGIGCKYGYGTISMQDVYPVQRYNYDQTTLYDFSKQPDIVILALGTNDNSIQSDATLKRAGLVEMLTLVREKNPTAPIVWIHGMMTTGVSAMIEEIVAEFGGADAGYYACRLTQNNAGGGSHPNLIGQQTFANELVAFIEANGLTDGTDAPVIPDEPDEPIVPDEPDEPIVPDTIITGGETSRTEENATGLGLAFKFNITANGIQVNNGNVADYTDATVTIDGVERKLVAVGAVVTNDPLKGLSDMTLADVDAKKTIDVKIERLLDLETNSASFAVRIINIPTDREKTVIYTRAYYIVEIDGKQETFYGDIYAANYANHIESNDGVLEW